MKLYAITASDYSEYHIFALTADKENAERIKAKLNFGVNDDCNSLAKIEEYEDIEITDERMILTVGFYEIEGKTQIYMLNAAGRFLKYCYSLNDDFKFEEGKIRKNWNGDYLVDVLANDKEQAIKIACDRLAEYKKHEK